MAIQPSGEEVQISEVVTPPPAMPAEESADRTLPATASTLPLIALLGLLALGGAFAFRIAERRA
jgi:MYXO-CTERM domain-containing protein